MIDSVSIADSLRPLQFTHHSDIALAHTKDTDKLWESVASFTIDTEDFRGMEKVKNATTTVGSMSDQGWHQAPSESSSVFWASAEAKVAETTDEDFVQSVLEPHGITIQHGGINKDLYRHFHFQELPSDPRDRLVAYKEMFPLHVWLSPDVDRVQWEYSAMRVYECNEAEHAAYALRDIFLAEPRNPWLLEAGGEQRWEPVRMLQLGQKPSQDEWLAPPNTGSPGKSYEWDIRPDCAYYVSLHAFKAAFRGSVRKHVSVAQKRAFAPYLSIGFKKDEETLAAVHHQIAVASAMALYNRYRLKSHALRASMQWWTPDHKAQMRHYGITFAGSSWDLWCTTPKTFDTWTGCKMSIIYSGDCCVFGGIQQLVSIVNDLHYWGLAIHGRFCKADIAAKIHSDHEAVAEDRVFL